MQVQAVGGPHPQSSIEYSLSRGREAIATVSSSSGLVEATSTGSIRIRAQAVGVDEETGQRIVYSEDEGEVSESSAKLSVMAWASNHRLYSRVSVPC